MNEALLFVDIQNDYFEGGNMELHQPEKAAQKAKEVFVKNIKQLFTYNILRTMKELLSSYPIQ